MGTQHPSTEKGTEPPNLGPFWATIKRFALCYRTVVMSCVCPVLSVTLVYCSQTVGRIKMKLFWHAGRPRPWPHGDPAPLPQMVTAVSQTFGPYLLRPKLRHGSRCHFLHGGRPRTGDFGLDGDPAPHLKKGSEPSPQFCSPFLLWSNGWMHHEAT